MTRGYLSLLNREAFLTPTKLLTRKNGVEIGSPDGDVSEGVAIKGGRMALDTQNLYVIVIRNL